MGDSSMNTPASVSENVFEKWPLRLLAMMSVLLCVAAARAYIGIFYWNQPIDEWLSWKAQDPPFLASGSEVRPIMGNHFFGDFQEVRSWGFLIRQNLDPYNFDVSYPPLAVLVGYPSSLLPTSLAYAVFVILPSAMLLCALAYLLRGLSTPLKLITLALVAYITTPFLSTLDRGNIQSLTNVLIAVSFLFAVRGRFRLASVTLGFAIAVDLSTVVLLLIPLLHKRWSLAISAAATAIATSVAAIVMLPGNDFASLMNLTANVQAAVSSAYLPWDSSALGLLRNLRTDPQNSFSESRISDLTIWLSISALYVAMVAIIISRRRVPQWLWGGLILAGMQVLAPSSYQYGKSWAIFAAVWFVVRNFSPGTDQYSKRGTHESGLHPILQIIWLLALAFTLTPIPVRIPFAGGSVAVESWLSVLLIVSALVGAFVSSVQTANNVRVISGGGTST